MGPKSSLPTGHVPALDALRGVAILLVLVFHLKPTVPLTSAAGWWAYRGLHAGWIGVDLFFVLSGFLITGILWDAKGTVSYFRTFYVRRVLRIFPLYYGALVLLFVVYPLVVSSPPPAYREVAGRQGWLWGYASNVRMYLTGVFGFWEGPFHLNHFWSLAVEEHFYLLWPVAVFFLGRRSLLAACVACVAAAVAWRTALVLGRQPFVGAYTFTPCRLDALAAGACLALAARGPAGLAGLRRPALVLAAVGGLALIGLFVGRGGLLAEDPWMQSGGYTLLAGFFAAVLVLAVTAPRDRLMDRLGRSRSLRFFGKYSYGLYVWHGLLLPLLLDLPTRGLATALGSVALAVIVQVVFSVAVCVAVALLSWHLYEKHFLGLKRFFEYRRPPAPSPAPGPVRGAVTPRAM